MFKQRKDIIVGIPSYKEEDTIGYVAQTAGEGLVKYFPALSSGIVNVDNASPDGTKDSFLKTKTRVEKDYVSTPKGVRGKGNNLLNLFNLAIRAKAKTVLILDADVTSITPEWVKRLAKPILDGYDFVAPLYSRHQFDGTITNHICYPLFYGLLGVDLRQPIGGDFALSRRLCSSLLRKEWTREIRHYGVDVFISLEAALGNFKVCQSGLGSKIHKVSAPKLGKMFEEVVSALFTGVLQKRRLWLNRRIEDVERPQLFGDRKMAEPQKLSLDVRYLKEKCRREYLKYRKTVKRYLSSYAFSRVDSMFEMDYYDMDVLLWTQILYTFLHGFDIADEEGRKEAINGLKALYYARTLAFDYSTWRYSIDYAEEEIRNQAIAFACQKPYFWGLYK